MRGGQQGSSKHGSQVIMPPLVRGAQVSLSKTFLLSSFIWQLFPSLPTQTTGNYLPLKIGLMAPLCTSLSLCLSLLFALMLWMSLLCPPLPLSAMSLSPRATPLIVLVRPSLCLHSRSRLSANSSSSSNSWLPLELQDPHHGCWAQGPQPLQARAREALSNQASLEL